ncbi:DUF4145 domain-containing protein [Polaromonas sp. YR568]|uniref:DUF4145 domain-containing protein n=1 Tax=Polaromonas sp. YR568 TaxID=1855301 RepID=UPI003137F793
MNKVFWTTWFTEEACPAWPCPSCHAGSLALKPATFTQTATKESFADQEEQWWGPENVVYSFTAWAACKNCSEEFALSGIGGVEQVPDDAHSSAYVDFYQIRHCHPTLELISLPAKCPNLVREALAAAFALYWLDRPSSAGRIRVALERLLDHFGIASKAETGKFISLDKRIDVFSQSDTANGPKLMALKWLGNVGAHTIDVQANDLLAAFEVFEHVLSEVIDKKSDSIAKLAAELTAKYKHG